MSQLFDRLNHELEVFGRRAQAALDEGKVQIEVLRLRRQRDGAARDLGLLIHRRERGGSGGGGGGGGGGGEIEPRRIEALLLRLDDLEAQLLRLEAEAADRRRDRTGPSARASAGSATDTAARAASEAAASAGAGTGSRI
jgi:50S ribosomal subunit-associated GTPase HflX